jgi:HlyD family secretion protein
MDDKIELKTSTPRETTAVAAPAARRQRSRRLWLVGAAIAALLLAAAGAWWRLSAPVPVHYVTAPASRGAITQMVTATGTVNPVLTIIVGSYVSGVIQQLFCDYNTRVRAGQVCATIDPRPYQATLDQYSGQLLRDQAILDKDRVDLARYQKLAEQNSIARQQAEDQFYLVHQDEATVKLDQALVDGAKLNLEYTDIVSPVDGTVVSRNVTGGQTVASTFQTPTLFLIATDLSKMQVDTNSSESDVGGVKEGNKAAFTVDAYPGRVFHGTVTQLRQSPQTVQNVVTYDAVVGVDNSDLALMPGMTASTQITIDQRSDVLRVPDQALRYAPSGLAGARPGATAGKESRLWVLRDGRPIEVPVTLGLDDGTFVEIAKGDIQPGDQVITAETRNQAGGRSGLLPPRL